MSIIKIHTTPPAIVKVNGVTVTKVFVRSIGLQGPPGGTGEDGDIIEKFWISENGTRFRQTINNDGTFQTELA